MMETEAAAAAVDWTRILLAYGPIAGTCIIGLVIVGRQNKQTADALRQLAMGFAAEMKESTRLKGRVQHEATRAISGLTRQVQRLGEGQAALMQATLAQPARYALEKHKARNGGWSPEELAERVEIVRRADESLTNAAEWDSSERSTGDPDESVESRIRRLRMEAELASSPERADELERRATMLEAELTAG